MIFPGPGDKLDRLRVPASAGVQIVPPSVERQLNDRQKKIVAHVLKEGFVTRNWCVQRFEVGHDTAHRELSNLVELRVLLRQGRGRSTRYVLVEQRKPG